MATRPYVCALALTNLLALGLTAPARAALFDVVDLVSDNQAIHPAQVPNGNLINPWGITASPASPFWVSDNKTGVATLYQVAPANNATTVLPRVVTIPTGGNTGTSFNPGAASGAFNGDNFVFVSENGTISGWRNALG